MENTQRGTIAAQPSLAKHALLQFLVGAVVITARSFLKHSPLPPTLAGKIAFYCGAGLGWLVVATIVFAVVRFAKPEKAIPITWAVMIFFGAIALIRAI